MFKNNETCEYCGRLIFPIDNGRWVSLAPAHSEIHEHKPATKLEKLRQALKAENISWGELVELQSLVAYIEEGDVELLEAAGVPEFEEESQ